MTAKIIIYAAIMITGISILAALFVRDIKRAHKHMEKTEGMDEQT